MPGVELGAGENGAEDGTRTRDPHLGKVMLYQLSHFRSKMRRPADGAESQIRTGDTAIFSRVLYQLSYLGPDPGPREAPSAGRRIPCAPIERQGDGLLREHGRGRRRAGSARGATPAAGTVRAAGAGGSGRRSGRTRGGRGREAQHDLGVVDRRLALQGAQAVDPVEDGRVGREQVRLLARHALDRVLEVQVLGRAVGDLERLRVERRSSPAPARGRADCGSARRRTRRPGTRAGG